MTSMKDMTSSQQPYRQLKDRIEGFSSFFRKRQCFSFMVFDAQASLKNQKVALLVVRRGAFLVGIGIIEDWCLDF